MNLVRLDVITCLSPYRDVMEVTLFNDPVGGWFLSKGVAYIDVGSTERQLRPLSHKLPWPSSDRACHAT